MRYDYEYNLKTFAEIPFSNWVSQLKEKIKKEIEEKGKEYLLSIDENEYKSYLIETYTFELLTIDLANPEIGEPEITKEWANNVIYDNSSQVEVYTFTVTYKYIGSPEIFKITPYPRSLVTLDVTINERLTTVSFKIKISKRDPDLFNRAKKDREMHAFKNLEQTNSNVQSWNSQLQDTIDSIYNGIKKRYLEENDFFAAINVRINKETLPVFTPPTLKKKIIPQPSIPKGQETSSEPTMSKEMYDDVLKVIYASGKNMEKKPALYKNKDEEELRDQFLFVLETRYESTTATGETFNRSGKADIILKYAKDGSNLFVAECKFWHGASEYLKAISQLFDKYLTWRDSKTALIVFVTNKDFSNVLNTIIAETKNHEHFIKENGKRGESSFSYLMKLPQDKNKQIFLEVIAFHYDKV